MKTDDLIRALAADSVPAPPVERALWPALALGLAASTILFLATLGTRPDLAQAIESLRFVIKPAFPLILIGGAMYALTRLWSPGRPVPLWALALAPAALAVALALELIALPAHQWGAALVGENALKCLFFISLFALTPLAVTLGALRRGAPTRPALTGAVAGLLSAGLGASLYALHCPDDSPLFVATWYVIASSFVAVLGAVIGARVLRW
jgi:hypothetical protein